MDKHESAFPVVEPGQPGGYGWVWHYGLTKREWFAGQTLVGLLANPRTAFEGALPTTPDGALRQLARTAFLVADAMLEEGSK